MDGIVRVGTIREVDMLPAEHDCLVDVRYYGGP